jgi:hypothetical protein
MYIKKETCRRLCVGLLSTALLGACSSTPGLAGHSTKASPKLNVVQLRKQRERTLTSMWDGKSYASLIEVLGQPSVVMEIPGQAAQTASIYGILDEATQCIDTFTVARLNMEMMVENYFCR